MAQLDKLWVEEFRPKTLDSYIFQDHNQKMAFHKMVADQSIPHLLLSGVQGSGKTTMAKILISEIGVDLSDVMVINGSDENNVETVREKIKNFVTTFAMGDYKIVNLEEMDYFSLPAQAILRNLMEEYSDVARFIITCNYDNKIMPAIKSRCQHYHFKACDKDDVAEMAVKILAEKKVKFKLDQVDKFIAIGHPDIRKVINLLQQHSVDGTLVNPHSEGEVGDYKFEMLDLMDSDNWIDIRKLLCSSVTNEEWEDVYKFLYENLHKCPKFTTPDNWEAGIVIIADHLYKHSICADSEINFAACVIRLGQV